MRLIDADKLEISKIAEFTDEYGDTVPVYGVMAEDIDKAPTVGTTRWVSVDEQLPEEDTRVLVWLREEKGEYTRIDTDRRYNGKWVRWQPRVTHWLPLPEPPAMELEVTKCEND